jgi:hypothetical protein
MSIAPFFNLVSEVLPVQRRDFTLAVPALLNPNNANPLLDGEWLGLNSSYQVVRGSGAQAKPTWPVYSERGRYDTQAIEKTTVLFGGFFEADSKIATLAGLTVGDWLTVDDVTIDALTKQGLVEAAGAGQHWIVGFVTRILADRVRFWHNGGFQITI